MNTTAKKTKEEIHSACEKLRVMVNEREAQLMSEVEELRYEKERELLDQKHQLEVIRFGSREAVEFGEILVKEGNESEIAASQKMVMSRLNNLGSEREKSVMEPVRDATMEFIGGDDQHGLKSVEGVIKGFGGVVSRDISAEKSSLDGLPSSPSSVLMNQPVVFKVNVVDKKGNKVSSSTSSKTMIPFVVGITCNGNQVPPQQVLFFSFYSFFLPFDIFFFPILLLE